MPTEAHSIRRRDAAKRLAVAVCLAAASLSPPPAHAVALADSPLFSTISVPGNLLLALSVEFPTALSPAYVTAYAQSTTYLGYFDPAKCYRYTDSDSKDADKGYFAPYSTNSSTPYTCTSTEDVPLWSGNYLNWASTQTLDAFRWVLTGGNRSDDSTTQTILQKAYNSGQGGNIEFSPNKSLTTAATVIAGATPFTGNALTTRTWGAGTRLWLSTSAVLTGRTNSINTTPYTNQYGTSLNASKVYSVNVRVKVCDSTKGLERNCVAYTSSGATNYKPEGLMQQHANKLRYAAFGYLADDDSGEPSDNQKRDGGVLRAPMKYIGPQQPVPNASSTTNAAAEWSASTGQMTINPDKTDADNTTAASRTATYEVTISQSGVMNYLNKFGDTAKTYKWFDPVSELYYAALRYLRNLDDVSAYSSLSGAGSVAKMKKWLDGFPVITARTDPIVYACQKNFILGIGDVNTHVDANLPGSTLRTDKEPDVPSAVSTDAWTNVKTATDMVGKLEGISSLGGTRIPVSWNDSTYYLAGLAYDAHTRDIRGDLTGTQTVNTYWMDVLERQKYMYNNVYYLATKYGGFTVPSGFVPDTASNDTTTLRNDAWHTNQDTLPPTGIALENGTATNLRPDNYFTGNDPETMRAGLTAAFAKISSETSVAFSTAFKTEKPAIPSGGGVSLAASYDPSTWTGTLTASSFTLPSAGSPAQRNQWEAGALLETMAAVAPEDATASLGNTRKIVTCCTTTTTGSPGLPFTASALTSAQTAGSLHARTNYSSFGAVPGISSSSQSAANFVAYLRGDTAQEVRNGGAYRTRARRLGDIVGSKPLMVAKPSLSLFNAYNPGYIDFRRTYSTRRPVVYVGANDGMLHAFDGTVGGADSGRELFAYVPSFVYGDSASAATSGLAALGNPSYSHRNYVDATPVSFDVDMKRTQGSTATQPDWVTLLVGGLGKGGKGYYALDITNPVAWTNESNVASKVKWEFSDSRMGYSYGAPLIVKTLKYGWVVVLTSGYNNSDGKGYFFFVNPRTGDLLEAVATPEGSASSPIDLAHAEAYIPNQNDWTADALYAGDLRGNLWRLDLTSASGTYAGPTRIASLSNANSEAQPVTIAPKVMIDRATSKRYVMIGTGRLLADTDATNASQQSFYAIVDGYQGFGRFYGATTGTQATPLPTNTTFPLTRRQLSANTNTLTGVSNGSVMGWYFDLPVDDDIAERVHVAIADDKTRGMVVFAGNRPSSSPCSPSGSGQTYGVAVATGKTVLVDPSGTPIASVVNSNAAITEAVIGGTGNQSGVYVGGRDGKVVSNNTQPRPPIALQPLNWREVPLAD